RGAGFERPALHGLCTYAIAGRALLRRLGHNDAGSLRRLDARLSSPVYPGETIRTEMWETGPGVAAFRCRVVERDAVVVSRGHVAFASVP
ncbi:MAG TPA: MaoC/PaaZ C-terminal domain-containing protein, partial [Stellaceae bacterium]|nr:MaoC/PaaZ C-terminal domain-containing protein [Stellaceae bacterium]